MPAGGCVPLRSSDRCLSITPPPRSPLSCLPRAGWFKEMAPLVEAFGPSMVCSQGLPKSWRCGVTPSPGPIVALG